ncbi:hypothetical protein [Amycolatopsis sp. WQ 127309]|uniref:hypothetical protein n=1 Tax=Amycolatopsis sp. WQ 127309 TaxID=2932773 RepID=UPI001FF4B2C7|nr:hypothetical protein [Amycolatopsis sp. WQ 127309]UOZ03544.1 hypothetical protein MUY22_32410 [Amycolatopsis sp. WQ 127309]
MGLFGGKPQATSCFFCSVDVEKSGLMAHYSIHLIEVVDNNGRQAYTFTCPRCGTMDQAWGGGRPNPLSNATSAVAVHLMDRHSIPLP